MPGILHQVCHSGYGYADPFIEKARHAVPVVNSVAERLEPYCTQYLPPVIEKADKYIDPYAQKIGDKVTPYYGRGVEKVGELKGTVDNYYGRGVEKVGNIRGSVDEYYCRGTEKVVELKGRGFEKVVELKCRGVEKVGELKGAVTPYYNTGIESVGKLRTVASRGRQEIGNICRVPPSENLQELARVRATALGRVRAKGLQVLETSEEFVHRWLPPAEGEQPATGSDSNASDESFKSLESAIMPRTVALPQVVMSRLVQLAMAKGAIFMISAQHLSAQVVDGSLRLRLSECASDLRVTMVAASGERLAALTPQARQQLDAVCTKVKSIREPISRLLDEHGEHIILWVPQRARLSGLQASTKARVLATKEALRPRIDAFGDTSTKALGSAVRFAFVGCERTFGVARTKAIFTAIEQRVPVPAAHILTEAAKLS